MPPRCRRESRFPVGEWRAAKVDSLLLLGDGSCAAEALADAVSHGLSVRAALGLEAADLAIEPPRSGFWVTTAGSFPLKRGTLIRR